MTDANQQAQSTIDNPLAAKTSEGNSHQVRLRVDERELSTNYANGYRTHLTNEEVMIDFGLNLVLPSRPSGGNGQSEAVDAEVLFRANDRVIMNYATAKRLAMTLGQAIRQYEQRFGEIKVNVDGRGAAKP